MKLKLGSKIGAGFGTLIVIAVILGGLAVFNMVRVESLSTLMAEQYLPEVEVSNQLERHSLLTMYAIRGYALSENAAYLAQGRKELTKVKADLAKAQSLATKYPELVKLRKNIALAIAEVKKYESLVNDTEQADAGMEEARGQMDAGAGKFMTACQAVLLSQDKSLKREITEGAGQPALHERHKKISLVNDVIDLGNSIRVTNFKAQATSDMALMQKILAQFGEINAKLAELEPITRVPADQEAVKAIDTGANAYKEALQQYLANWTKLRKLGKLRDDSARQVLSVAQATAGAGLSHTQKIAKLSVESLGMATWVMIVGLVVAVVLGIIIAWVITRSITRPVLAMGEAVQFAADSDFSFTVDEAFLGRSDELGDMLRHVQEMAMHLSITMSEATMAADTVATSSNEMSQGNQELNNRTQQQASAIEETASAIEEMTGSVKQNANNSQQALELANRTSEMARQGGAVLNKTVGAMEAVTESSKKISEIIGVVNEIAFQTNLLALNAAVEAARAGEAGRGFAVVAGEVRNLAGRSAGAAKEIQTLITDSGGKVEQGNELVSESGHLLKEIIENVQAVADTMGEINAASQEQARGIDEVNRAVNLMDEGVQQNAALVEESASASENMASAAEQLRSQMSQFKVRTAGAPTRTLPEPQAPRPAPAPRPAAKAAARPQPAPAQPRPKSKPQAAKKGAKAGSGDDFFDGVDLEGFEEF